jgi:hypothetical protein
MNTIVIEHVALNELPAAWQARLAGAFKTRVTVRIEEEMEPIDAAALTDNPLFGLWQDRDDMADVSAYARRLRAPRYALDDATKHADDANGKGE